VKRAFARGFSLVEMMVAMTIGLILLAGALSVLYSSKVTYNENERVGRLQETGRAAVDLILRDLRTGGFKGCDQTTTITNALASPTGLLWNFQAPVEGFESTGAGAWSPAIDTALIPSARDGSDIIAVRTTRLESPTFITSVSMASSTANTITATRTGSATIPNDSTVMISDCTAAAAFEVDFSASGSTVTLTKGTADLGIPFPVGSRIVPVDTVIYYLRDSGTVRNGVRNPSLWRIVGNTTPQELIEGIEAMQLLYGVDTDGDRLVNSYVKASGVGAANWNRVISVSIALLVRSVEPNSITTDARAYTLLDATVAAANDRYERTLYTTTVTLRNNTQ
jgi:type IV pilus assembly protein PilW